MRCGHDVFDAVGMRQIAHLLGDFPGLGSVVYLGEDMAVDVNHGDFVRFKQNCGERKSL
jgi:hypothetical protein